MLGLHIEGPFISKAKKGAHPEHCIISDLSHTNIPAAVKKQDDPTAAEESGTRTLNLLELVYGPNFYTHTSIVTIAPELPSALSVIKELSQNKGITVSIG